MSMAGISSVDLSNAVVLCRWSLVLWSGTLSLKPASVSCVGK